MPNRQNPPLGFTNDIQRNASNTFFISSAAGAVVKLLQLSSIPVLMLGFAPFYEKDHKAVVLFNQ